MDEDGMLSGCGDEANTPSTILQNNEDLFFDVTPKVGQQFHSLDDAHSFYNAYAKLLGFGTKIKNSTTNKAGVVTWRAFACSKEGKTNVSSRKKNKTTNERNRGQTRCGCLARMHVSMNHKEGVWVVSLFEKIHNHDLVSPSKTHLIRSHRKVSSSKRALIDEWGDANIETHTQIRLLENEAGGLSSMGCTETDLYNYNASLKSKFNGIDVKTMIHGFQTEKQRNGDFFYKFDIDSEKVLTRCFWADSDSRNSYMFFGEVVVFDTTFNTNKYGFYLAPIVGVNHHRQTTVFGCGLLMDQSAESFRWLLSTFIEAMDHRPHPKVIITDQDAAIARAVADVLPNVSHHHCLWHILKKFPEKMNVSSPYYTQLHKELVDIIMHSATTSDFEERWTEKLLLPELIENKWLVDIYEAREKWVPSFVKHIFCAGMLSSQRVESTHAFFKKYVNKHCTVSQCVTRITRAIVRQRHRELIADHRDRNEVPKLKSSYLMEKQMVKIYTKAIFCKFQKELDACALYTCHQISISTNTKVYDVIRCEIDSTSTFTKRQVTYDMSLDFVSCSCKKMEFIGIPCRHILIWMRLEQVLLLPDRYILHRWTKKAKMNPLYRPTSNSFVGKKLWARRVQLRLSAFEVVDSASLTEERSTYLAGVLKNAMEHLAQMDDGGGNTGQQSALSTELPNVLVRDPKTIKVKGSGSRVKHPSERAKRCRKCKKTGHNARSCQVSRTEGSLNVNQGFDLNLPGSNAEI